MSTGAEDALDTLLSVLEPHNAFDMMIAYLIHRLILAPSSEDQNNQSRYHPVGTAFTYLGKCVREVSDTFFIDEWLSQGGAMVFIRVSFNVTWHIDALFSSFFLTIGHEPSHDSCTQVDCGIHCWISIRIRWWHLPILGWSTSRSDKSSQTLRVSSSQATIKS